MNKAQQMLDQAVQTLEQAHEELNRPDEDVMTMSVCHQARTVMAGLMASFLSLKGKDYSHARDLESLRELSGHFDPRFNELNLESMVCHPSQLMGEKCYCMDIDRVKSCLVLADQCKVLVTEAFAEVSF